MKWEPIQRSSSAGYSSRTHPLTPKRNQELTAAIGSHHAEAFDQLGSLYYSEEDYDDFYYGKDQRFPISMDPLVFCSSKLLQGSRAGKRSWSVNLSLPFGINSRRHCLP